MPNLRTSASPPQPYRSSTRVSNCFNILLVIDAVLDSPLAALIRAQESIMNHEDLKLEPLPYQLELRNYLRSHEPEIWNWFASGSSASRLC